MAKKIYSKAELTTLANDWFETNTKADTVYATVDGNIFTMENRANLHAGAKGKVYTFERTAVETDTTDGNTTIKAKEAIALIENAATLEELEALGFQDDTRSTVKAAYTKKLAELTTPNQE